MGSSQSPRCCRVPVDLLQGGMNVSADDRNPVQHAIGRCGVRSTGHAQPRARQKARHQQQGEPESEARHCLLLRTSWRWFISPECERRARDCGRGRIVVNLKRFLRSNRKLCGFPSSNPTDKPADRAAYSDRQASRQRASDDGRFNVFSMPPPMPTGLMPVRLGSPTRDMDTG